MMKPLVQAQADASVPRAVPPNRSPDDLRERAEQLRAAGLGYKRIGKALGVTRDQARHLLRPRAPRPAPRPPRAHLSCFLPVADREAFRDLCAANGTNMSAELRRLIRRRLEEANR